MQRTALITIVLVSLALRLTLALTHDNYLGVDGGAYLLSRNAVLGDEPTGAGFPRPPLAPGWQLVPFTSVLGDDNGYKAWSAIAATFPLLAVYLISRRFLTPWQALLPVLFVSIDMLHAEMFVTGALPLQGFTLIGVAIWAMWRLADPREFQWRYVALLGTCIPLTVYVNQTSAGLIAIALPAFMLFLAATYRGSSLSLPQRVLAAPFTYLPMTIGMLIGGLVALSALPWYLAIAPGSEILRYPGPWVYLTHWPDSAWFQVAIAMPVAYWLVRYAEDYRIRALGCLVGTFGILLVFMSTDETIINIFYRSRYILAVFIYPAIAWMVFKYWWPGLFFLLRGRLAFPRRAARAAPLAVALALVGLGGWEYVNSFHGQAQYSDMATEGTVAALEVADADQTGQGIVSNSFTLSLWVAALNRVESPHIWTWEPPRAYTETDRDVRCVLGWVSGCDWQASVAKLGVSHVLVDHRFPNYNDRAPGIYKAPPDQWEVTARAPWLELEFEQGTTKLWRIRL